MTKKDHNHQYSLDFISDVQSNTPIFSSANFDVYVGRLPEDKLPQFVILNNVYGVVEFACNNEYMWRDWIESMEERIRTKVETRPKAEVVQLHS